MMQERPKQAMRFYVAALAALWLSACSTAPECPVCPTTPATSSPPAKTASDTAADLPADRSVRPMQPAGWRDLPGWENEDLSAAWPAFLQSCLALSKRPQWPQWRAACEAAKPLAATDQTTLRRFFEAHFRPYRLTNPDGSTSGLITGYYEPLLQGARQRTAKFAYPALGVPDDLLTIELSAILPDLKHQRLRGRLQGNQVVPYYSRAEITGQMQKYADHALLWVDDAVDLFFLQVQGSGRVRLTDGRMVRLSYANQNGHPYRSIGRELVERGELTVEQASMQGIRTWVRANPGRAGALFNSNPSYVFFRESAVNGDEGPNGALGVPLTAGRSIAVDARHVPLGAPVFLATTQPDSATPLHRLVLAQDTGGAIRGVVRADYFWGFGAEAGDRAGKMRQQGQMWVILPPGVAPRTD